MTRNGFTQRDSKINVVFDFGEVIFNTSVNKMYEKIFLVEENKSEEELNYFLSNIFTKEARSKANFGNMKEVIEPLAQEYPKWAKYLNYFKADQRFTDQVISTVDSMPQAIYDLRMNRDIKVYGLTNWAGDTFETLNRKFNSVTDMFNGIVVSGKIGIKKPDPKNVFFFDDKIKNVEAAKNTVGWNATVFKNANSFTTTMNKAFGYN